VSGRARSPSANDPETVRREYASEERFLARRLAAQACLSGLLVEDVAIEAMSAARPDRVLDVGCGTADFTERLRRDLGVEVTGLDLSPRMVELARARGIAAGQGDIQALPFGNESFDCVLANRVLYHLPDLDKGLSEIARVLYPGGRLVAITYSDLHLAQLFECVGRAPDTSPFSAENGAASISGHFGAVEHQAVTGTATFRSFDAIIALLAAHDEFGYFTGLDLHERLNHVRLPFEATYRHALFIASDPTAVPARARG
jgi:SAM-dependent methyltransferase